MNTAYVFCGERKIQSYKHTNRLTNSRGLSESADLGLYFAAKIFVKIYVIYVCHCFSFSFFFFFFFFFCTKLYIIKLPPLFHNELNSVFFFLFCFFLLLFYFFFYTKLYFIKLLPLLHNELNGVVHCLAAFFWLR